MAAPLYKKGDRVQARTEVRAYFIRRNIPTENLKVNRVHSSVFAEGVWVYAFLGHVGFVSEDKIQFSEGPW